MVRGPLCIKVWALGFTVYGLAVPTVSSLRNCATLHMARGKEEEMEEELSPCGDRAMTL